MGYSSSSSQAAVQFHIFISMSSKGEPGSAGPTRQPRPVGPVVAKLGASAVGIPRLSGAAPQHGRLMSCGQIIATSHDLTGEILQFGQMYITDGYLCARVGATFGVRATKAAPVRLQPSTSLQAQ